MSDPVFDPMQFEEFRLLVLNCEAAPNDRSRFYPVADWLREHGDAEYADAWEWIANHYQVEFSRSECEPRFWSMRLAEKYEDYTAFAFVFEVPRSLEVFVTDIAKPSKNMSEAERASLAVMVKVIQLRLKQMRDTLNPKDSK